MGLRNGPLRLAARAPHQTKLICGWGSGATALNCRCRCYLQWAAKSRGLTGTVIPLRFAVPTRIAPSKYSPYNPETQQSGHALLRHTISVCKGAPEWYSSLGSEVSISLLKKVHGMLQYHLLRCGVQSLMTPTEAQIRVQTGRHALKYWNP